MAEEAADIMAEGDGIDEAVESLPPAGEDAQPYESRWSAVWQLPVLLAGVVLLGLGIWSAMPRKEPDRFPEALNSVENFLEARNYDDARTQLDKIKEHLSRATDPDRGRYLMLRSDLVYLAQLKMGWDVFENHEKIIGLYARAKELGQLFDEQHVARRIHTLVAMGKDDEAIEALDQLEGQRYPLIRQVIERRRALPESDHQRISELLARFKEEVRRETDPKLRRDAELWAAHLTSVLMMAQGHPDRVVDYLPEQIIRLEQYDSAGSDLASERAVVPLYLNLAKAYRRIGEDGKAEYWFERSQQRLDKLDALNAEVLVGLAQIALAQSSDVHKALGYFAAAESSFPSSPAYLDAVIGRADCEARLGVHSEALEHFGRAVKRLVEQRSPDAEDVARVAGVIRSHYDLNVGNDQTDRALDYLTVLLPLYPADLPTPLLLDFGVTHEKIGSERRAAGLALKPAASAKSIPVAVVTKRAEARRIENQEAAMHYKLAGDYFRRHAHRVTVQDDDLHGASLWKAANSYDEAQRWEEAIAVYGEFVRWRDKDPRHLIAIHRLGQAFMANGQPEAAAEKFEQLVKGHPNSDPAHASIVPWARALIALGRQDEAQRRLEAVLKVDPAITPDSRHYRDALIELGQLHYSNRAVTEAAPLLRMAVELYGDSPQGPALRFRWADSLRQSIEAVDASLAEPISQTRRQVLTDERAERLTTAQGLFGQVIEGLSIRPPDDLSKLERVFLRNAYFYRPDCAYNLGQYTEAIDLYDEAAKQFKDEPVSLVALMQIVNAYCQMGDLDAARTVNRRARLQLRGIPEEKFDDPSLPISRRHWEDWLKWSAELKSGIPSQANAAAAVPG